MTHNDDGLKVSGEQIAAALAKLVRSSSDNAGSEPTLGSAASQDVELDEEEKRKRREARMKKRLEKKKRKREMLLTEFSGDNVHHSKERSQVKNDSHSTPSETTSSLNVEKPKLKLTIKKKNVEASSVISSRLQEMNPSEKREKVKKPKPSKICFPINEECTSIKLSPSGRHIIAGFTDGTLRLFDTTGRLWKPQTSVKSSSSIDETIKSEMSSLFDSDSDDEDNSENSKRSSHRSKQRMVASKSFQNFGAVACQIHAKGVITSLLMDVDCCEEGRFAFGGVLRGSTELVAVDLTEIEKFHDSYDKDGADILDLIKVYRYSDAKLKGFGACIRLKSSNKVEYRLFTGKGIKNMHIWSFIPPSGDEKEPSWQCLYDTPTNGNTISYLKFRRDAYGLLQGISKSDDQKLRIWDLSHEERDYKDDRPVRSIIKQLAQKSEKEIGDGRPKRPPYVDVLSTEHALGVCGAYVFSGGDSMYNKMGVMYLDVEDIQSQFNHTELPLPNINCSTAPGYFVDPGRRSARNGRQQRGDLKSVVKVVGLGNDAHHVLLELSDQTLVHYCQKGNQSSLTPLKKLKASQGDRKLGVTYIRMKDSYVLAMSCYEGAKSRGTITLRYLSDDLESGSVGHSVRTGFSEAQLRQEKTLQNKQNLDLVHSTHDSLSSQILKAEKSVDSTNLKSQSSLPIKEPAKGASETCNSTFTDPLCRMSNNKSLTDTNESRKLSQAIFTKVEDTCASKKVAKSSAFKKQHGNGTESSYQFDNVSTQNTLSLEGPVSSKKRLSDDHTKPQKVMDASKRTKSDIAVATNHIKAQKVAEAPPAKISEALTPVQNKNLASDTTNYPKAPKIADVSKVKISKALIPSQISLTSHEPIAPKIGDVKKKISNTVSSTSATNKPFGENNQGIKAKKLSDSSNQTISKEPKSLTSTEKLVCVTTHRTKSRKNNGPLKQNTSYPSVTSKEKFACDAKNVSSVKRLEAKKITLSSRTSGGHSKETPHKPDQESQTSFVSDTLLLTKSNSTPINKSNRSWNSLVAKDEANQSNLLVTPDLKIRERGKADATTASLLKSTPPSSHIAPTSFVITDDQTSPPKSTSPESSRKHINLEPCTKEISSSINRAAVSPEQAKKDRLESSVDSPVVESSKSISQYFLNTNTEKEGSKTCKDVDGRRGNRSSNKITADVQFLKKRKQSIQELDIASALCELRKIAEATTTLPNGNSDVSEKRVASPPKARDDMEEYLLRCHKRKRPKFSHHTCLPSVSVRTGIASPVYKNTGTVFSESSDDLEKSQFEARRRLAMHHRASHERFRKAVISSGERVMNLITCSSGLADWNRNQLIEFASSTLIHDLEHHRTTLNDMLDRQRLEAASLAGTQMLERGSKVPELSVSFPFPEVFEQVKVSTMKYLSAV